MIEGVLDPHVDIDALQGGAGTSTNLAVDEVLANRALVLLGHPPGEYSVIDPIADVNRHQSTNDTFPTALRVAAITGFRQLDRELSHLLLRFEALERRYADLIKLGRTELQDAVPTTVGATFGAMGEAVSRDRWRMYHAEERLRPVNLGGTAIGTGIGAPSGWSARAVAHLRRLTGYGVYGAQNLVEATQNGDAYAEASGHLRTFASSLVKICCDLRLLSSGPEGGLGELRLPARQAGSSIMPGKINPVIPEAAIQAGLAALGRDQVLVHAVAMGNLELNAFLPLVADCLLTSIDELGRAARILADHCLDGIEVDAARCAAQAASATAAATALVEEFGYHRAEAFLREARSRGVSVDRIAAEQNRVSADDA